MADQQQDNQISDNNSNDDGEDWFLYEQEGMAIPQDVVRLRVNEGVRVVQKRICFDYPRLKIVELAKSVESIEQSAFYGCRALLKVTIPKEGCELASIGDAAFSCCHSLSEINLDAVTKLAGIGRCAFYKCESLTSIDLSIATSLKTIMDASFYSCTSLKIVILPQLLERIEGCSFAWCENMESIDFPMTIRHICNSSFVNCTKLKKISLPATVHIQYEAFQYCVSLQTVLFKWRSSCRKNSNPVCVLNLHHFQNRVFKGCKSLIEFMLADGRTVPLAFWPYILSQYWNGGVERSEEEDVYEDSALSRNFISRLWICKTNSQTAGFCFLRNHVFQLFQTEKANVANHKRPATTTPTTLRESETKRILF